MHNHTYNNSRAYLPEPLLRDYDKNPIRSGKRERGNTSNASYLAPFVY